MKIIVKNSLLFLTGVAVFGFSCIFPSKPSGAALGLFEPFGTLAIVCGLSVLTVAGLTCLCEWLFNKKQKSEIGKKAITCLGEASLELLKDVRPLLVIVSGYYSIATFINPTCINFMHLSITILGIVVFTIMFRRMQL